MEPEKPIQPQQEPEEEPSPPQPIPAKKTWALGTALGLLVATGGAIFALVSATAGATRGGTRSCKLEWEQREHEVAQAIEREHSADVEVSARLKADNERSERGMSADVDLND